MDASVERNWLFLRCLKYIFTHVVFENFLNYSDPSTYPFGTTLLSKPVLKASRSSRAASLLLPHEDSQTVTLSELRLWGKSGSKSRLDYLYARSLSWSFALLF